MVTHSSILAWRIPWTEELGRLQSVGSQRVGLELRTSTFTFTTVMYRRRPKLQKILFLSFKLCWHIIDSQCCVNLCYTVKRFSYTHIYSYSYSFPLRFITGYWIYFPVLCSRILLFIRLTYTGLHVLTPGSQSFPPHPLSNYRSVPCVYFYFIGRFTCVIF